jgi:hypothetical protein
MIIIPCGIDCDVASLLQKYNLRHSSLPLDWSVSYGGVSKIIKNDFHDFIPTNNNKINTIYNNYFLHNEFPQDTEKMIRRCNRLLDILTNTSEEVIFIRKGHAFRHHNETIIHNLQLVNDIADAENLSSILKEKYPNLCYKIIIALICDTCFEKNTNFVSNDVNVKIYNISTPTYEYEKFETLFKNIFLK